MKEKDLQKKGFTLIELLIVVAIIAILAAIAVPNFLEAQVRAKVSRVRNDLRTVATGLESYAVDSNTYPLNDGVYNVVPVRLTSPVAYLTNSKLVDPFSDKLVHPVHGELARFYTYTKIVTQDEMMQLVSGGKPAPPVEAVDSSALNKGAFERYGRWRLVSNGPDKKYSYTGIAASPFNPNPTVLMGADIPYDPSNGTVSMGNVLRTQKSPDGIAIGQ